MEYCNCHFFSFPISIDIGSKFLALCKSSSSLFSFFRDARSSALELSLQKLGVQHVSTDDVERMQWLALEAKTVDWTQFMRIAVRILLHICLWCMSLDIQLTGYASIGETLTCWRTKNM